MKMSLDAARVGSAISDAFDENPANDMAALRDRVDEPQRRGPIQSGKRERWPDQQGRRPLCRGSLGLRADRGTRTSKLKFDDACIRARGT